MLGFPHPLTPTHASFKNVTPGSQQDPSLVAIPVVRYGSNRTVTGLDANRGIHAVLHVSGLSGILEPCQSGRENLGSDEGLNCIMLNSCSTAGVVYLRTDEIVIIYIPFQRRRFRSSLQMISKREFLCLIPNTVTNKVRMPNKIVRSVPTMV